MIDSQLSQVKEKNDNDIAVLSGLGLVIMMEDFYLFSAMVVKSL